MGTWSEGTDGVIISGNDLRRKKNVAELLEQRHQANQERESRRQFEPDYYIAQTGPSILFIIALVLSSAVGVVWLCECADREMGARAEALEYILAHQNERDLLHPELHAGVLRAKDVLARTPLFGIARRLVVDSFVGVWVGGAHGVMGAAMASMLQQHWFVLLFSLSLLLLFFGAILALCYMCCTPKLWGGHRPAKRVRIRTE